MGSCVHLKSKVPEHSPKIGEKRKKREDVTYLALLIGQMVSCAPALRPGTEPSHTDNVPVYLEMGSTKAETSIQMTVGWSNFK